MNMKNILGFATAFASVLLIAGIVRASLLSRDGLTAPAKGGHAEHAPARQAPDDGKAGGMNKGDGDKKADDSAAETPSEEPSELKDLLNANDPVTGEKLADAKLVLEHKGWRINFANDDSRKKFEKNPNRFYAKLSLEPTSDGKLSVVDGSKYEKATAETCAIMGGDIDPDGDVFILHRGFKVYFCCWSGCADKFLKEPSRYYAHYGLEEKGGKLVKK